MLHAASWDILLALKVKEYSANNHNSYGFCKNFENLKNRSYNESHKEMSQIMTNYSQIVCIDLGLLITVNISF